MSDRRPRPATGAIIGRRAEQQDAVLAEPTERDDGAPGLLLIVADGMGGHAGGQVASQVAIEAFACAYRMGGALPAAARLRAALEIANQAIAAKIVERPELRGMGSTLVAALVFGDRVQWISVGDSPLLAVRNGELIRLNADHSLAPEIDRAALAGRISQAEADNDPARHVLLSAVTGGPISMIDEGQQRLGKGAFVLLATDGLLTLPAARIAELASAPMSAARKVAALLDAVAAGMPDDQDNTSLAAVHCGAALRPRGGWRRSRRALGLLLMMLALAGAFCVALLLTEREAARPAAHGGNGRRPPAAQPPAAAGPGPTGPRIDKPAKRPPRTAPRRPAASDAAESNAQAPSPAANDSAAAPRRERPASATPAQPRPTPSPAPPAPPANPKGADPRSRPRADPAAAPGGDA